MKIFAYCLREFDEKLEKAELNVRLFLPEERTGISNMNLATIRSQTVGILIHNLVATTRLSPMPGK